MAAARFSGIFQTARAGFESFLQISREAKVKAAANTLEQNRAKLSASAAELYAVTATYLPQVHFFWKTTNPFCESSNHAIFSFSLA